MLYSISSALIVYIITIVIVKSHLFTFIRCWFRLHTLWAIKGHPKNMLHPIDCRLCTGAWISGVVTLAAVLMSLITWKEGLQNYFITYGLSYFLATQER